MFKCDVCGREMTITEIDYAEGIAWVCCSVYYELGDDKHDAYSVELTKEIEDMFLKEV